MRDEKTRDRKVYTKLKQIIGKLTNSIIKCGISFNANFGKHERVKIIKTRKIE